MADGLIAYDLEPPARLLPTDCRLDDIFGPRAEGRRRIAVREAAEREARNQVALADARAEWQAAREQLAGNAPALAVLDLHQPEAGYESRPVCGECQEDDGSGDAGRTPWRCRTFTAITGEGS